MKKATNLSVDAALLEEARALDLNLSRIFEAGLTRSVADERARRWRAVNAEAIESSNAWVERNGLPLARHRQF